jgi:hypothetical protein
MDGWLDREPPPQVANNWHRRRMCLTGYLVFISGRVARWLADPGPVWGFVW